MNSIHVGCGSREAQSHALGYRDGILRHVCHLHVKHNVRDNVGETVGDYAAVSIEQRGVAGDNLSSSHGSLYRDEHLSPSGYGCTLRAAKDSMRCSGTGGEGGRFRDSRLRGFRSSSTSYWNRISIKQSHGSSLNADFFDGIVEIMAAQENVGIQSLGYNELARGCLRSDSDGKGRDSNNIKSMPRGACEVYHVGLPIY